MNIWFLIMIIVDSLNIGISLAKHGQPRETNYNFFSRLIGCGIDIFIIYMAIKTGF